MNRTAATAAAPDRPERPGSGPVPPTRTRPRRPKARHPFAPWLFLAPFAVLFLLTYLIPLALAVYESAITVRRTGELGLGGTERVFGGLHNYGVALGQSDFLESFGRMLLFGIVQIPIMLALATVLALILETLSDRWAGALRTAYFLPYGVPGVIASILWGFLYVPGLSPIVALGRSVGLDLDLLGYDTILWSIANISLWQFAGYNMLVVIAQLKAVPPDLLEAARVDGAGPVVIARRIQLPLIRPALILTAVFSIIGTLQIFAEPLVLRPLSPAITSRYTPNLSAFNEAFANNNIGLASAQAVILALVAGVLSFTFLRLVGRRERS